MSTTTTAPRTLSATLLATAVAAAPLTASAADLRVHVQAPFDLQNRQFDLERLEYQNLTPVFHRSFEVPYATIEPLLANALEDVAGRNLHFYIKCSGLGIDELCPDTDIRVYVHSSFRFTQKGQPQVSQLGSASDNKFRVKLDAQARIGLDIAIHHDTGIWYSGSETIDIYALIGAHAQADLKLWPKIGASGLTASLTRDGGNIEIDGLSGQIIGAGAIAGAVLLGPVGAALGALLGAWGADAADAAIKEAINEAIDDQLSAANVQVRDLIKSQVDPQIAAITDYQDKALNTKIPTLGNRTAAELLALGPASLDVRTRTANNEVAVVATTRMNTTPAGKSLQGVLRFPKTRCVYQGGGNKTVGYVKIPTAVEPINADLAGKSCSEVVDGANFLRAAYLGESPEKLLRSGQASNELPSWKPIGKVTTSGQVVVKNDYYECPYTVGDLPAASILDLSVAKDGPLAARLEAYAFRTRVLHVGLLGPALLFDAKGAPKNPTAFNFGGAGPKSLADCPASYSAGTGWQKNPLASLKDKFDLDKCPMCGALDVFNVDDLVSQPGRDVVLDPVADKLGVAKAVDKARGELAGQGAVQGLQRVQATLDGGLIARSWDNVAAARALHTKSRSGFKVKQGLKSVARKQGVRVLDKGKAVRVDAAHLPDASLPKVEVEVQFKGKAAK